MTVRSGPWYLLPCALHRALRAASRAGALCGSLIGLLCLPLLLVAQARPHLDPQQIAQLTNKHEVLLFSDAIGAGSLRHKAIGLFEASPEEILRVATSYDHYHEYLPRLQSHVISQGPGEALVLVTAELPWPMNNVWVYARYQQDPPPNQTQSQGQGQTYRVRFSKVRGNLLRYEGSLLIEPFGDGRTTVTYELIAEPDTRLPRSWVQRAVGRGASNFVHFLRGRINHMQRPEEE